MSNSINQVTLIGVVGKDPEVNHYPNGTVIAKFPLATSESYKDKNTGEQTEKTTWHNLQCWGGFAEKIEREVRKGTRLWIDGKNANDSWEDENKVKHYKSYVQINRFEILAKTQPKNGNDYMNRM
ncbi:MAG: single-stranded DNA-binding protein [Bacteroidales bacterium]|nr:single-stranded DNA-binding protein [Bacteroidales bacterium]